MAALQAQEDTLIAVLEKIPQGKPKFPTAWSGTTWLCSPCVEWDLCKEPLLIGAAQELAMVAGSTGSMAVPL